MKSRENFKLYEISPVVRFDWDKPRLPNKNLHHYTSCELSYELSINNVKHIPYVVFLNISLIVSADSRELGLIL